MLGAAVVNLEPCYPDALASEPMPGQRAGDFAAHVQVRDFGWFKWRPGGMEVRDHGPLRSRNISRAAGGVTTAGIADALSHLTGWNTKHS